MNVTPQDSCSDDHEKDLNPSLPREESSQILEMAKNLDTQVMTLTAEDTMDAEQEGDQPEGMTVDANGPFNSIEVTREISGGQAATTTTSNASRNETAAAMEETGPKQH